MVFRTSIRISLVRANRRGGNASRRVQKVLCLLFRLPCEITAVELRPIFHVCAGTTRVFSMAGRLSVAHFLYRIVLSDYRDSAEIVHSRIATPGHAGDDVIYRLL